MTSSSPVSALCSFVSFTRDVVVEAGRRGGGGGRAWRLIVFLFSWFFSSFLSTSLRLGPVIHYRIQRLQSDTSQRTGSMHRRPNSRHHQVRFIRLILFFSLKSASFWAFSLQWTDRSFNLHFGWLISLLPFPRPPSSAWAHV